MRYLLALLGSLIFLGSSASGAYYYMRKTHMTIPFLEKTPMQVLGLAIRNSDEIKLFSFESNANFNINMKSFGLGRIDERTLSWLPYGRVLGEKITSSSSDGIIPQVLGEKIGGQAGEQKDGFNATFTISQKGRKDTRDKEKTNSETDTKLAFEFEGKKFELDIQAKKFDDTAYLRMGKLPSPLNLFLGSFTEQWLVVNYEELKKLGDSSEDLADSTGIDALYLVPNDAVGSLDKEKEAAERIKERIGEALKNAGLLSFDNRHNDEQIDGAECYHYTISLNRENAVAYIKDYDNIVKEELARAGIEKSKLFPYANDAQLSEIVSKALGCLESNSFDVWIGKKDFYLRKIDYSLAVDSSKWPSSNPASASAKVAISGNSHLFDFGTPFEVAIPDGAKSVNQIFEEMKKKREASLEGSRRKSRDSKRVADIKQIQTALELYFNDNDRYPDDLSDLLPENTDRRYLWSDLKNPTPGGMDYEYAIKDGGARYILKFKLEEDAMRLAGGEVLCASPEGMGVDCLTGKNETKIDSDKDSLNDWEEKNVYLTDPTKSDTDGDGFADGREVTGGYDPLAAKAKINYESAAHFAIMKIEREILEDPEKVSIYEYFSHEDRGYIEKMLEMNFDQYREKRKNLLKTKTDKAIFNGQAKQIASINFTGKKILPDGMVKLYYTIHYKKPENWTGYFSSESSEAKVLAPVDGIWMIDMSEEVDELRENEYMIPIFKEMLNKERGFDADKINEPETKD